MCDDIYYYSDYSIWRTARTRLFPYTTLFRSEALGGTLTLHTGTTITNEATGTLEAANGAILDVQDGVRSNENTTKRMAVNNTGRRQLDDETLKLTSRGNVTMAGGNNATHDSY